MTTLAIDAAADADVASCHCLPLECAAAEATCGAKAVNLARLMGAGLPVPEGAVLTVGALHEFLHATGLGAEIEALQRRHAEPQDAQDLEHSVRERIARAPLPAQTRALISQLRSDLHACAPVAVRSSAVGEDAGDASYAGLLDSVLDVDPATGLEAALKRVWASRWSARAASYARTRGKPLAAIAVIVQRQIEARYAGVLFTRSPERDRSHEMLCEYGTGLAERLVAGAIVPARLRIDRTTCEWRRDDELTVEQPPRAQIEALADAALAAERLFGTPQDIEWAIDAAGRVWLVQSRPITTALPRQAARRRIVWSNANVNENFPQPISPLLYSVVAPGYSAYFTNLGKAFGIARWRLDGMEADLRAIVGVHAGRLYYNLSAIHRVLRQVPLGERLVAWFDDFTGAAAPEVESRAHGAGFVRGMRDALEATWIAARTAWQYAGIGRRIVRFERCVDAFAARSAPHRLAALDTVALRDLLRAFMRIRLERWTDAALCDTAAMVCYGALKMAVARAVAQAEAASLHNDLLKGLTGLKSAEPVNALWTLAQTVRSDAALRDLFDREPVDRITDRIENDSRYAAFQRQFQDYLQQWGFRCSGELMLTTASFQERPEALLEIVRSYARESEASPQARLARQRAERAQATARVLAAARRRRYRTWLPWPNRASGMPALIAATHAAIALRERARLKQALLYNRLRMIAREIGSRLVAAGMLTERDHVFFLTVAELDELLSGRTMFPRDTVRLVALRSDAHSRFDELSPPDTFAAEEGQYPSFGSPLPVHGKSLTRLHGISVCGGVATGRARVLTEVSQTRELTAGDILVTRQTDPGWAPAFVHIGGLVLERGGMLSHGAILAREYGIPTVVGIAGATGAVADGATVRVDGDHGDVHVLA
jgi:pyruvate,water dikinase